MFIEYVVGIDIDYLFFGQVLELQFGSFCNLWCMFVYEDVFIELVVVDVLIKVMDLKYGIQIL